MLKYEANKKEEYSLIKQFLEDSGVKLTEESVIKTVKHLTRSREIKRSKNGKYILNVSLSQGSSSFIHNFIY